MGSKNQKRGTGDFLISLGKHKTIEESSIERSIICLNSHLYWTLNFMLRARVARSFSGLYDQYNVRSAEINEASYKQHFQLAHGEYIPSRDLIGPRSRLPHRHIGIARPFTPSLASFRGTWKALAGKIWRGILLVGRYGGILEEPQIVPP